METLQESVQKVSPKERIKLALKFLLVVGIFYLLFKKGLVTWESIQKVLTQTHILFLCIALVVLNTLLGTLRWMWLLRGHNVQLSFLETLRYNLIGSFFNIALPGAVSGDVIKAIYIAKSYKEKKSYVLGSILFDRILGVSALVLVASISTFLSSLISWGAQLPPLLVKAIYFSGLLVVLFYLFLSLSKKFDPFEKTFKKLSNYNKRLEVFEKIYFGIIHYRTLLPAVYKGLALSLVIHLLIVTVAFLLSQALAEVPLTFSSLSVVVPIGLLATAIPVLPAGVGTGHAAFYYLFHLIHSNQGAEIFSWIVLFQALIGALGGVVYMRTSTKRPKID